MHQQTNHHWFSQWFIAWLAPSHYQNQCCDIVYWNLRNKLQWNLKRNSYIFIKEKCIWKMSSGRWWPFCLGLNVLICSVSAGVVTRAVQRMQQIRQKSCCGTVVKNCHRIFSALLVHVMQLKINGRRSIVFSCLKKKLYQNHFVCLSKVIKLFFQGNRISVASSTCSLIRNQRREVSYLCWSRRISLIFIILF